MPVAQAAVPIAAELWWALPAAAFDCHAFGEEVAVFVRATADTHVLSPAAGAVLLAMLDTPGIEHDLTMWFKLIFPDPSTVDDGADAAVFADLLTELERIGVVARRLP